MRKYKEKTIREITCKYCKKVFQIPRWRLNTAKYCSYECSNKDRTTERAYDKPRICKHCGKEFLPKHWTQKNCNRKCFLDSVNKKLTASCKKCGTKFRKARKDQIYCSRDCTAGSKTPEKFKKNMADGLWAALIKARAGFKCEYCGKEQGLNAHHIFSRSNMATRWDVNNGISLCVSHHVFGKFSAHKAPLEFAEWIIENRGQVWYEELKRKSKTIASRTNSEKKELYAKLRQDLKKYGITRIR